MNDHVQLSEETIDRLRELKRHGDSYDDIVRQLLKDDRNDLERKERTAGVGRNAGEA